jgi:catechol 2,3-dioxygenase-like lactoylglutathione lyase family enzyme
MGFLSTIVVVEDVMQSRTLYEGILGCRVAGDFGIYNVGFEGGLSLYQEALFRELTGDLGIYHRSNNFVLYFEVEDVGALEDTICEQGFDLVHRTREQPWGQRTFRFYHYDGHIVEIAEVMTAVIRRLYRETQSVEIVARKTGYSEGQVREGAECPRIAPVVWIRFRPIRAIRC